MTEPGHNASAQIRSIVERIERLEGEKRAIGEDVKDVYTEAKSNGYDVKALRTIIKMRREDAQKRAEQDSIIETYMAALGMLADLPLGQAALEREGLRP